MQQRQRGGERSDGLSRSRNRCRHASRVQSVPFTNLVFTVYFHLFSFLLKILFCASFFSKKINFQISSRVYYNSLFVSDSSSRSSVRSYGPDLSTAFNLHLSCSGLQAALLARSQNSKHISSDSRSLKYCVLLSLNIRIHKTVQNTPSLL